MKFLASLLFIFLVNSIVGQVKTLPEDLVQNIIKRIDAGTNPSIAIGIIDKDGPRYYSFGKKKKGGKKINEHTIYEIGSISKVFTGLLLADQIVNGKLNADDPVQKYLPSSTSIPTFEDQEITFGNLSDHTSSLPRMPDNFSPADPNNPYADYTVEQMYAFLSSYKLDRPIGSEYEYSNLAVGLLGHILSVKERKMSYEDLLTGSITEPLKMYETKVTLSKKMKKNLAIGHNQGIAVANWDLPTFAGAGGIRSSVHDMLLFVAANLELNSTPLKKAMLLSHMPRHNKAGGSRVGLGWHINPGTNGDVIWHNGATGGYTTFTGFVKETGMGVVVLTNSSEGVDDIGFHLLDSGSPLRSVIPHIAIRLKEIIDEEGVSDLTAKFDNLKKGGKDKYDFSETGINALGYYYLNRKEFPKAKTIFLLNIREYPEAFNVYDSYAEALMENGEKDLAIENYKKSIELNPGNTNGFEMLAKIGVKVEIPVFEVSDDILQSYIGTYELVPGFQMTITRNQSQLSGQATGQGIYEIYPSSATEFYYKVVDAQIVFNKNDSGAVESLTLYQGGQALTGKKIN